MARGDSWDSDDICSVFAFNIGHLYGGPLGSVIQDPQEGLDAVIEMRIGADAIESQPDPPVLDHHSGQLSGRPTFLEIVSQQGGLFLCLHQNAVPDS